ncbi:MAG TPA: hypothetical protein VIX37_08140, partial [Candidatus Sulfotelmatobacter sp.]
MIDGDIGVGLAGLKANSAVKNFRRFGKRKGAYVNVVAWADGQTAFEEKGKRHVEGLDCILVELGDMQLLESTMEIPESPEELIAMRQTSLRQPNDTAFGTYQIWRRDEANLKTTRHPL